MWILKYSLDDNLLSCKLFIMWHCDSVGPSLYVLCCRLRAFQLIAPIDVGRQGQDSYRSPPQRSTTPSSVFQYDNKTDLEVNNTGYLMTLMMLGEDRIQDIVRTQCHNVTMSQCHIVTLFSQRYICQEHWGLQLLESWLSPPPPEGRDLLKATRLLGEESRRSYLLLTFDILQEIMEAVETILQSIQLHAKNWFPTWAF